MKRIVLVMALAITGCGFAPKAPLRTNVASESHTQIVATVGQVKTTTGAVATHIDKAATNIGTALQISSTIPSAKPVVAPLQASNDEIFAAKREISTLQAQIGSLTQQLDAQGSQIAELVKAQETAVASIATLNQRLVTETAARKAAEQKYSDAWLGGRALRWIWGLSTAFIVAMIVGLVLNARTDIFVTPLKWIAALLHPGGGK